MKATLAALWILSLAAAFGLARLTAPDRDRSDLRTLEAFRAGLTERDDLERSHRLSAFLRELGPDELPAALEVFEEHQHGVRPHDIRLLMHAWTRFDAPGAFAWAHDWPTPWRDALMREALFAWGFRDGPAAVRTYEALEDPDLKSLVSSLREGWMQSDNREGIAEYVANIEVPQIRRKLTFLLTSRILADGPDALIRWVDALPEDAPNDFKQGAFYHAAGHVARRDPRRAAAWFEEHRTHWYSEGSLALIAHHWVWHHDPPAVFAWLGSLPREGEREAEPRDAIAAAFGAWHEEDPDAAEAWLHSALPDPALDPAVEELVKALLPSSQTSAAAWAQRIEDEELRDRVAMRVVRRQQANDRRAASTRPGRSGLPEPVEQPIHRDAGPTAGQRAAEPVAEPGDR